MPERFGSTPARRTTGATSGQTLVGFAAVAFLYFAGEVLQPLALSVLLAFALTPASSRLERLGVPRALAVILTLSIALGALGTVGAVVARQLASLAVQLPDYQENIESKLGFVFDSRATAAGDRLNAMVDRVTARLEEPRSGDPEAQAPIRQVRVVDEVSFQERLRAAVGPYLETLGVASFVFVLVLFMMVGREDLRDRIVALFGHRHVGLTTRTMEEISARISRYLITIALLNTGFGLVIGTGLALIGVPFAVLWGSLAALLRFVPYVGAAVAAGLPTIFAAAHLPGWTEVIGVVVLFGIVETMLSSFLEPVVFGRTTGISSLGLLVAAMFWTWLWGAMGLLLSTPMTVCLAVIGKYVPSLNFFATLLGEEVDLQPHLRYYQRVVALDREGAVAVVQAELAERPPVDMFDRVLIPALAAAGRDAGHGRLDDMERAFLWDVTSSVLDELERTPPAESEGAAPMPADAASRRVVGLALGRSDALVLRMLARALEPSDVALELLPLGLSPLQIRETLEKHAPSTVVISHLPPEGFASVRYLVRRLRVQLPGLPILLGLWGRGQGARTVSHRLIDGGPFWLASTIAEARDRVLRMGFPSEVGQPDGAPLPA